MFAYRRGPSGSGFFLGVSSCPRSISTTCPRSVSDDRRRVVATRPARPQGAWKCWREAGSRFDAMSRWRVEARASIESRLLCFWPRTSSTTGIKVTGAGSPLPPAAPFLVRNSPFARISCTAGVLFGNSLPCRCGMIDMSSRPFSNFLDVCGVPYGCGEDLSVLLVNFYCWCV